MEKIKASENNYGDIVIYFTPTKEQKQYIDQILKLEGLKKKSCCFTIGTIKENFNISMEKREAGLKVLMRKVIFFFRGKKIAFDEHKVLLFKTLRLLLNKIEVINTYTTIIQT